MSLSRAPFSILVVTSLCAAAVAAAAAVAPAADAAAAADTSPALDARAALAAPWRPAPPCAPPLGVAEPAVPEAMCSREVASTAGGIVVREIGEPAAATLVTVHVDSSVWYDALATGIQIIIAYFSGENAKGKKFL